MLILAFDTATGVATSALVDGDELLGERVSRAQTLLDVPAFDFDDQKLQPLPTPVDLHPDDTLRVTCTHDATLRGQLPQLSKLPPRYVVWGDGTSDEMRLTLLTATVRDDGPTP